MRNILLTGAGAAIIAAGFAAAPADAQRRYVTTKVCTKWRGNHCAKSRNVRHHAARYRVGHRLGPRYAYTSYRALPRTYVVRYDLNPRYRYVYSDGYIYVVDPRTYAIERIIYALTR